MVRSVIKKVTGLVVENLQADAGGIDPETDKVSEDGADAPRAPPTPSVLVKLKTDDLGCRGAVQKRQLRIVFIRSVDDESRWYTKNNN